MYGTRLTLALVAQKLKEHRHIEGVQMNVVEPGDLIELGAFTIEFIKVNHSIAGACALAIHTPVGTVVHTGDFKVDFTPVDGEPINLGRFAELGRKGVLLLLADSTNSERTGYTMSEKKVCQTFNTLFEKRRGASSSPCSPATSTAYSPWWIRPCALGARSAWWAAAWSTSPAPPCSWAICAFPRGGSSAWTRSTAMRNNEITVLTTGSQASR